MAVLNKLLLGGRVPANAVYIGRPSRWGNPFHLNRDGTRDEVVAMYEDWLKIQIATGRISQTDLASLHGKDLVCFCAPRKCHGHILEKYAEEAYRKR